MSPLSRTFLSLIRRETDLAGPSNIAPDDRLEGVGGPMSSQAVMRELVLR